MGDCWAGLAIKHPAARGRRAPSFRTGFSNGIGEGRLVGRPAARATVGVAEEEIAAICTIPRLSPLHTWMDNGDTIPASSARLR